jgi:hypothetical protein
VQARTHLRIHLLLDRRPVRRREVILYLQGLVLLQLRDCAHFTPAVERHLLVLQDYLLPTALKVLAHLVLLVTTRSPREELLLLRERNGSLPLRIQNALIVGPLLLGVLALV